MSPASISVSVCCMGQSWKCERSACEGKQPCFSVLGWNGGVHRDQDTISPWKTWKYQVTNYRKKKKHATPPWPKKKQSKGTEISDDSNKGEKHKGLKASHFSKDVQEPVPSISHLILHSCRYIDIDTCIDGYMMFPKGRKLPGILSLWLQHTGEGRGTPWGQGLNFI